MRKFRHFLMTAAVLGSALTSWAEQTTFENEAGNLKFTVTNGKNVSVSKGTNLPEGDIVIDATVTNPDDGETYTVTSLGYMGFKDCGSLTSITIPEGVTAISQYAFSGCTGLTSITIPERVTYIGSDAFKDCSNLTSITIPERVTYIGSSAFSGCSNLTTINIPEGVTSIEGSMFSGCSGLTSITIPEGVTSIGYGAFYNCSNLTTINIPDGVTSIGGAAFYNCSNLTTINIPDGVTSIGGAAFYNCSNLTTINIPDGVTSIDHYTFYNCSSLTSSINIPEGVTSIGYNAFEGCSNLTSVTIPKSVTSIGNTAFNNCSSLTEVNIPNGVTNIDYSTFYNCSSLTSITIPEGVTSIGNQAFRNCSSLTSITIPKSVTSIGYGAFSGCSGLTSVTISEGVTSIGSLAFSFCSSVTSITIPGSVTSIGNQAFSNCYSLTSITISDGVTSIENQAFYFDNSCSGLTSITIPKSVTSIGSYAFCNCSNATIYCEKESKPDDWDEGWTSRSSDYIKWGCKVVRAAANNAEYGEVAVEGENYAVAGNDGSLWYLPDTENENVKLTAAAAEHCHFVKWSDGNTVNPRTVTVSENNKYTAEFALDSHDVEVVAENGTATGSGSYLYGKEATVSVTANEHYHFVAWDNGETNDEFTFTVAGDTTITAIIEIDTHSVSATADNGGTVEGTREYDYGSDAVLTVKPATGYHFTQWTDDATAANPRTVKVTSDTAFAAQTAINIYEVSATADNGGKVEGTGEYAHGSDAVLTVKPATGYHFKQWADDATAANPRTVSITSDTAFAAQTEINVYEVKATTEHGTVTNLGNHNYGSEVTFTAQPESGYKLAYWGNGSTDNSLTMTITDNIDLEPRFILSSLGVYSITVDADENGSANGGGSLLVENEEITISATASANYHFVQWSDGNTDNPRTISVKGNKKYTAEFAIDTYNVNAVAGANGTVTGGKTYNYGETATLTATAAEGYHFVRWSDGNTAAVRTLTVSGNVELTAEFAINTYTVKLTSDKNGKVAGAGTYNHGAEATLTATANAGYHFVKWSDGATESTRKVSVTGNLELVAEFAINTYEVKVLAANGTAEGAGTYNHGAKATISAAAAEGYHFAQWSDGTSSASRTVTITSDTTFTAEFAINTYTVKVSASNGSVEGAGTYEHGAEATLTAAAAEGYHFTQWSDGITESTRKVKVTSDLSFTAEFAVNSYMVKVDSAANGNISGAGTYEYGAVATLKATANEGYHFVIWSDSLTSATRKVTVTSDTTFGAEFAANTYELKAKATNGTVEGAGTYEYGAEATLKATPAVGYRFVKWSDGNTDNPRTVTVTGDKTYTANFEAETFTIRVSAENGAINGAAGTFAFGAEATLTAVPDNGYRFVKWSDGNTDNPRIVTINAALLLQTADLSFTAIFEKADNTAINDDEAAEANIYAYGKTIVVENASDDIFVFDALGRLISRVAANADRTEIQIDMTGVYVVKTANTTKRVIIN